MALACLTVREEERILGPGFWDKCAVTRCDPLIAGSTGHCMDKCGMMGRIVGCFGAGLVCRVG